MGEMADAYINRIIDAYCFGRSRGRVRPTYTTCRRCDKENLIWYNGKCHEQNGSEHLCQLNFKQRMKELQRKAPEMNLEVREMLISERAARLKMYDDANPDVGWGLTWAVAYLDAEEQLISEKKIRPLTSSSV